MNLNASNRLLVLGAFALGLIAVAWVGWGFVGTSAIALTMTLAIGAVYVLGAQEIRRYSALTASLADAMTGVPQPLAQLSDWLDRLPPALQGPVRARIEGERSNLPGLALTPYLIGLLVMLGMLGTFLGLVVTFRGAVFTLEGTADLQAIRSALAEPIKGLGLAFGTSVVGVATSAMLGLMSPVSRPQRQHVVRKLYAQDATVFRPGSLAHQRNET
ncbi:MAG: hypothetical protein U1E12_09220, partial [Hydrogenophaga sp.]|nr:hypothetical protein [Hydrogenophaga sp.]